MSKYGFESRYEDGAPMHFRRPDGSTFGCSDSSIAAELNSLSDALEAEKNRTG